MDGRDDDIGPLDVQVVMGVGDSVEARLRQRSGRMLAAASRPWVWISSYSAAVSPDGGRVVDGPGDVDHRDARQRPGGVDLVEVVSKRYFS